MPATTTTRLLEYCPSGVGTLEGNVLRDCKILGFESRWGHRYTEAAVERAAGLYEGAPVYIDHNELAALEKKARPFIEKFGTFKNVRFVPGQGLRGDFHFNPRHVYAETFRGWVESAPEEVGFSHDADGKTRKDSGGTTITEIVRVRSVDLVSTPATTQGLFVAMPDLMTPETSVDTSAEESYETQLGKLIAGICTDESLSIKEKRKKVLAALKLMDDGEADVQKTEEAAAEETKAEEKKTEEAFAGVVDRLATRLLEAVTAKLTESAPARSTAKAPVALPPTRTTRPALTVDALVSACRS